MVLINMKESHFSWSEDFIFDVYEVNTANRAGLCVV